MSEEFEELFDNLGSDSESKYEFESESEDFDKSFGLEEFYGSDNSDKVPSGFSNLFNDEELENIMEDLRKAIKHVEDRFQALIEEMNREYYAWKKSSDELIGRYVNALTDLLEMKDGATNLAKSLARSTPDRALIGEEENDRISWELSEINVQIICAIKFYPFNEEVQFLVRKVGELEICESMFKREAKKEFANEKTISRVLLSTLIIAIDDILKNKKGAIEKASDLLIGMRKRKWTKDGWTNDGWTNDGQPTKKRQTSV